MKEITRKKLELLAPAGSFEALKAAISNGADAVYLGGGKFNARINAGNFTENELIKALDYAHERGAKVYITLNTLLKNEELEEAAEFAAFVYREGADAVIIQDQGLLHVLRKFLPDLNIHASTQMTLTNSRSVKSVDELGVKRVVLPRELSLEQIRFISERCGAELEVFAHGALCVCYSGQCLMSSFIGGRSGNRGLCAQPCRLPWSLSKNNSAYGKPSYLISPRDLMAIDLLPQLKEAGVKSLKLEGRMKSPEYVAIVTSVYRKYMDLSEEDREYVVDESDKEKLMQAFNRGGFTRSYLSGDRNYRNLVYASHPKNQGVLIGTTLDSKPLYVRIALDKTLHMGDGIEIYDEKKGVLSLIVTDIMKNGSHSRLAEPGESPWVGDIKTSVNKGSMVRRTMSRPLFDEARKTYEHGEAALVPVDMHFRLRTGEAAVLEVSDGCSDIAIKSEINAEKALNKPLSVERTKEQLQKTGDTPYQVRNIEIDTDGVSTIPVSILNALRRSALESISSRRIELHKKALNGRQPEPVIKEGPGNDVGTGSNIDSGNKLALSAYFYEMPAELGRLNGLVERVYLPSAPIKNLGDLRNEFTGELFLWTPSILKDTELTQLMKRLTEVSDMWDGLAYGNGGFLPAFKEAFPKKQFCADYTVNIFNDEALALQKELGAKTGTLSPELRLSEVETFLESGLELEAIVYGRIPLMTMEHCPASLESECSGLCASCSNRKGTLKDRKEEAFPFARDPVLRVTRIFNAMPMLMDDTTALGKTGLSLLRLTFTDEDKETCENVARHYYNKLRGAADDPKISEIIQKIKDQGFTKGHWFRGV